jgi:hypothetical protein
MRAVHVLCAALLLHLGMTACEGEEAQGSGGSRRCTPGESRACACPNGSESVKVCVSTGSGFHPCECGGGGAEPRDVVEPELIEDVSPVDDADAPPADLIPGDAPPTDTPSDTPPDTCAPQCAGKDCGPDGCGGTCGVCPTGQACAPDGRCVSAACGSADTQVTGVLSTELGDIDFDAVSVSVTHKQDVDPFEDGCIVHVQIDLQRGSGCHLSLVAAERVDVNGRLEIREVTLSADSQCPGFPDDREGTYQLGGTPEVGDLAPGLVKVPDSNAPSSCFHSVMPVTLSGALVRTSPSPSVALALLGSTLQISGDFTSAGSMTASCPCTWSCEGLVCGSDGCGGSCGACGCGEVCDLGQCLFSACDGKDCGPDGCGGSCGACEQWPGSFCGVDGSCGCTTSCQGKDCGDDSCGGSCGACGCGEVCASGQCDFTACDGKGCGADGCGGVCGTCGCGHDCQWGACVFTACDGKDCGPDGCGGACGTCGCGESCSWGSCTFTACDDKDCGTDGCGGSCGSCTACGEVCSWGSCTFTACGGKDCGADGCGGSCGSCDTWANEVCGADQQCHCTPSCASKVCGDDGCGGSCGACAGAQELCVAGACLYQGGCFESGAPGCDHCACEQCACEQDSYCCDSAWDDVCVGICQDDCGGCGACEPSCPADASFCGLDGCNQPCTTCDSGTVCHEEHCCAPTCPAGHCGDDGCGDVCGDANCEADQVCLEGSCCTPHCAEGVCGDDGCGGVCGASNCPPDTYCADWDGADGLCHAGAAGDPCDNAARCDDGEACTEDQCVGGACAFDDALCCEDDEGCDDGDPDCTTDACVDGLCVFTPTGAAGCCEAEVLVTDFEGGLPAGTTGVYTSGTIVEWHHTELGRSHSGDKALYYGSPSSWDYDNGSINSGKITIPNLSIPAGYGARLSAWLYLDVEDDAAYDTLQIGLKDAQGTTRGLWEKADATTQKTWFQIDLDVSAFAGMTVAVVIAFDTYDNSWNETEGVYVDDLALISTCAVPSCTTSAGCDDGLSFTSEVCSAGLCVYTLAP